MMKLLRKDPEIIFIIGELGFIIAICSKNSFINTVLLPIFIIVQLIGVFFIIKDYWKEHKRNQTNQNEMKSTNSSDKDTYK